MIDDLTIANKKLKEENKRLKRSHSSHLANDRLFEVTIHKMSAQNRRLLEHKLREFTASINDSSYENVKTSSGTPDSQKPKSKLKHSITSTDSNSQPVDSAYSSMTSLLQTPRDTTHDVTRQGKENNIENYLDNIPARSLPKHFANMTDRQKKKLVVQRLEQLFTGKVSMQNEMHSQPQQQEEVSKSARTSNEKAGIREANMLLKPMEMDSRPGNLERSQSTYDQEPTNMSPSLGNSPDKSGQRPTRPIDLDPDRAQVPGDNVEYLRHLGLSTPHLMSEDSSDAEPDAQGWIYLNLLINMAQLHIVNVTPDFVRDAVQDVSDKFQISRDGDKLRWRGGSKGTQFSSESETNSGPNQSPNDSDSVFEVGSKRRKVDKDRFATIPINVQDSQRFKAPGAFPAGIHYQPLFNHQNSSSDGSGTSSKGSSMSLYPAEEYGTGHWRNQRSWSATSRSGSQNKKRREDGTMVFYSNARFCTDLSGDQDIPLPIHVTGVGEDGFSNHTRNALGCEPRHGMPTISRTPSGSTLPGRPFKSQITIESRELELETPDLQVYNIEESNMELDSVDASEITNAYQTFEASGLGGVRPEDHFAVQVNTRRSQNSVSPTPKLSKFSSPGARVRRFHHRIPSSSLTSFESPDSHDSITEKLASLTTFNNPVSKSKSSLKPAVKIEYLSRTFTMLKPSPLPQAIGYYGATTDSETSSGSVESSREDSVESRNLHRMNTDPKTMNWTRDVSGRMQVLFEEESARFSQADNMMEEEEEEHDDDDDDESIDMMAHLRAADPEESARREAEFDAATKALSVLEPRSSVATVAESDSAESGSEDSY